MLRIFSGRETGTGGGGRGLGGSAVPIVCKQCGKMLRQTRDSNHREPMLICKPCLKKARR